MQSAAYITGENLYETRRALNVHYQNRHRDLAHAKTLIPEGVPGEWGDVSVCDRMESFEDVYAAKRFPHDLDARIKYLAFHFLGKPHHQTSREWRYGRKGSLAIQVAGSKQGLYANFETGEYGRAVTFIADQLGVSRKEAFQWGAQWLGDNRSLHESLTQHTSFSSSKRQEKAWIPIFPITSSIPSPDLKQEHHLHSMMRGRHEIERYAYKDAEGRLLGYVVRLEDKDGHKITPTLTYCRHDKGVHQWRFQGFGEGRPLYGLDALKDQPIHPVLVVEGEKTADAARNLFKDHVVVTWSVGCGSLHKSNWSVLKGRDVTLWPDHDQTGQKAMQKIQEILGDSLT